MGAYKVDRRRKCGCGKPAPFEVFNTFNSSQGHFCEVCGNRRVRDLDEEYALYKATLHEIQAPASRAPGEAPG